MARAKASISPRQQSFPLHVTSYFKTKAFSYCIPSTHTPYLLSLSSARSSCVLHTVAQITPEFPEHCGRYSTENDVGLYHICNGSDVYGRPEFQVWGTNLCKNLLFFSCWPREARATRLGGERVRWISFLWQQGLFKRITRQITEGSTSTKLLKCESLCKAMMGKLGWNERFWLDDTGKRIPWELSVDDQWQEQKTWTC